MKNLMVKLITVSTTTLFLFSTTLKPITFPQFPKNFEKITCPTKLIQLSVGKNEVWGVDGENKIYQCKITEKKFEWVTRINRLKYISVGYDDRPWGIGVNNKPYECNDAKTNWINRGNYYIPPFKLMLVTLTQLSIGQEKLNYIWGVDPRGRLYFYGKYAIAGLDDTHTFYFWKKHKQPMNKIPLKHVSCGYDGDLWAIGKDDDSVWRWNKKDNNWESIITLTQVDVGDKDHVVGVYKDHTAYLHDNNISRWHTIGKNIENISINKDGDIWLVTTKGDVYRGTFRVK